MNTLSKEEILLFMKDTLAAHQQTNEQFVLVPDASLAENGIDSLCIIMLFSRLEEHAKIKWEGEDLDPERYETVSGLADFMVRQQA